MRLFREPAFWPLLAGFLTAAAIAVAVSTAGVRLERPEALPAQRADEATPAAREAATVCSSLLRLPEPGDPRRFHPSYTQVTEVDGVAIVGMDSVSLEAFRVAADTVRRVFAANDLERPLAEAGAYVVIVPAGKTVLDMPEFACLRQEGAAFLADVCGVADAAGYPVVTVDERDLLGDRRGPCGGLNVLFHELGHLVHSWALGPAEYFESKFLYADAIAAGKYAGEYAATNANEYFAEGTQAFFASVDRRGRRDRAWLREYDPALYALLARVYGEE